MPSQNISVSVNIAAIRGRLCRSLQRTMLLVAAGLQNLDQLDPQFLELPTAFKLQFDANMKWTKEQATQNYSEWVLSNGFRDAIETFGGILEESHQVLSVWELSALEKQGTRLSGSHWNDIVIDGNRRFHKLGIPQKLSHISEDHTLALDSQILSHVLSINKARNCLVHRGGIVTNQDLARDEELKITWRRIGLFRKHGGREEPVHIPATLEAGEELVIRHEDVGKVFPKGSVVVFSAQEFSESCWSLIVAGEELIQKMDAFGIDNGFLIPS